MTFLLEILQAIGAVTPAVERHVSDVGDDDEDGSPTRPYRTIARAIADWPGLASGRRLVIKVEGAHHRTVNLPSHVTLEGFGAGAQLRASSPGPAIRIEGTAGLPVTDVEVRDIKIRGEGPFVGQGGAMLVEHADGVTIERCELHDSVAARGGGLAVLRSDRVTVDRCLVHDNTAGTPATALTDARIAPSLRVPAGHGHGGGIYVRDSTTRITGCNVSENHAILFGGGIAVSNETRPGAAVEIVDCEVTANQVSHPPLGVLGAPAGIRRADMGDPVRAAFADALVPAGDEERIVALLHGMNFESGLGGGIGIRLATNATRIARCRIGITRAGVAGANQARRGGGIACYSGGYPRIEDNEIAHNLAGGDGGGIGIDLFDPYLPPGTASAFGVTAAPMIPRVAIEVTRNHIHQNAALEDGGGLYASGAAKVVVFGGRVERNRSAEDGGGLRVTYASELRVEGVAIRENRSNVVGNESDGGGGVAARNASVTLVDCELTGNVARGFAGGAVYFISCWEGGVSGLAIPSRVSNEHSTFDETMEAPTAFDFRTRVLRIVNCRGSGNQALGGSGAGGFLYAVRSAEPGPDGIIGGGEAMWVDIEGPRTLIGTNKSEHSNAAMRKRGNVVIELSGRLDGAPIPMPQDRVWIGRDIPADAIAPSEPALPPATARAVLVAVDRDPARDQALMVWTGAGVSFGVVPAIGAVAPTSAPADGGTTLTLAGSGFEVGSVVRVDGAVAAQVSRTATQLVVTSPPGAPGPADVTVTSPSGAVATLPAGLAYTP